MSLDGEIILQLNNVESSYGPVKAIRGVSLKVQQGSIVTVLGANGAGKSTILKTISGIIDPQKGRSRRRIRPGSCARASPMCPKAAKSSRC